MAACASCQPAVGEIRVLLPVTPHQPAQEGAEIEARTSTSFPQPEFPSQFAVYSFFCGFIPLEFLGMELGANCPPAQVRVF